MSCLAYKEEFVPFSGGRAAIPTDDIDSVSDVAQDDRSFAPHLARVVTTVTILHVYTVSRYNDNVSIIIIISSSSSSVSTSSIMLN